MTSGPKPTPLAERLWQGLTVTEGDCWEWPSLDGDGYGRIWVGSRADGTRRNARAHRVSYELFVGPIPEGLVLDHLCRNPPCVNPDHLEPVTTQVNTVVRGEGPVAAQARQVACKNGHPFTAENTWISPTGGKRFCRTCRRVKAGVRNPRAPYGRRSV